MSSDSHGDSPPRTKCEGAPARWRKWIQNKLAKSKSQAGEKNNVVLQGRAINCAYMGSLVVQYSSEQGLALQMQQTTSWDV